MEFAGTASAQPSLSFLNSGTAPGSTSVRYDTCHGSSSAFRVNTSSQRASPPLFALASARNQRGQPAFLGMVYSASENSSGLWSGLPAGLLARPAFSRAPSMSASGPVTYSASSVLS
ncbi:hypothetical protein SGLAM104S_05133 [Streptomyces glaucescens]